MEAGEIVTVFGVKCSIRAILTPGDFGWTETSKPHLVVLIDKVEEPKPDIRWERIPDPIKNVYIAHSGLIADATEVFGSRRGDDWAFPNWRDFIGQMFDRPEGGNA